jgi:hypothetical protein
MQPFAVFTLAIFCSHKDSQHKTHIYSHNYILVQNMTGFLEQNNHVAFYGKWFPIPPRNPQFQSCVPDLLFQSTRLRH